MGKSASMMFPVAVLSSAFNATAKGSFRPMLQNAFKTHVGLRANTDASEEMLECICDQYGLDIEAVESWFKSSCYVEETDYIKACKILFSRYRRDGKLPLTSMSVKTFLDFYSNDESKSEIDKISLLAVLALRSIIGNRVAGYVSWEMILSRMAGNLHKCSVEELPEPIRKYNSRKLRDKLRNAMIRKWKVQYYFKGRKPWYSLKRPPFELKKWVDESGTP